MAGVANRIDDLGKWKVQDLVFRVEGAETGEFITYDPDRCDGCAACVLVCAAGLWSVPQGTGKARLSARYRQHCLECAACYAVCERDAIGYRYPNGGSGIVIRHG